MQVGDLVRHVVHTEAMGIIIDIVFQVPYLEPTSKRRLRVHWLNTDWKHQWTFDQNVETIDE